MTLIHETEALIKRLIQKKVLVFDFDGVLVDSVNVKTEAFSVLYQSYGDEVVEQIVNYHLLHGGVSRFEKFRFYEEQVLGHKVNKYDLESLSLRFSELVLNNVVNAEEIASATDFLIRSHTAGFKCVVNSATPDDELKLIIEKRNIGQYLDGVYGSPSSKCTNLKDIIEGGLFLTEDLLFFGDAKADMCAADEMNVDFVGVGSSIIPFIEETERECYHIHDFKDLLKSEHWTSSLEA